MRRGQIIGNLIFVIADRAAKVKVFLIPDSRNGAFWQICRINVQKGLACIKPAPAFAAPIGAFIEKARIILQAVGDSGNLAVDTARADRQCNACINQSVIAVREIWLHGISGAALRSPEQIVDTLLMIDRIENIGIHVGDFTLATDVKGMAVPCILDQGVGFLGASNSEIRFGKRQLAFPADRAGPLEPENSRGGRKRAVSDFLFSRDSQIIEARPAFQLIERAIKRFKV